MNQKHPSSTAGLTLANQATVEPYMIRRLNAYTENCQFTVDCDAAGANPFLNLATRRKAGSRKRLLKPPPFLTALTTSVSITGCELRVALSDDIKFLAFGIIGQLGRRLPTPTCGCSLSVPSRRPWVPDSSFAVPHRPTTVTNLS